MANSNTDVYTVRTIFDGLLGAESTFEEGDYSDPREEAFSLFLTLTDRVMAPGTTVQLFDGSDDVIAEVTAS